MYVCIDKSTNIGGERERERAFNFCKEDLSGGPSLSWEGS